MVEWGGYDPTNNQNMMIDEDVIFVLQFTSKKPQSDWGKSPLYISRKFAGDNKSLDLNITPTDGIVQVFRMSGPTDFKDISISPNPNQGLTLCSFKVYQEGNTTIGIYDVAGREQMEVINQHYPIGSYSKVLNLGYLDPGIYLAVYKSQDRTSTKRLIKTN